LVVLATALASLLAIATSTAGAVTWHNTGAESFHATGGPVTLTVGVNNFSCLGSTMTGTAPASAATTVYAMTMTATYSPCTLAGQNFYMHCGTATYTGSAWVAGPPALTAGTVDMTCDLRLTANDQGICHLSGSTPASYTNPDGATPGRFTYTTSSTLTISNFGATSCFLGTGTAGWSENTVTMTAGGPILTRTA
jgi:hypothetical protein